MIENTLKILLISLVVLFATVPAYAESEYDYLKLTEMWFEDGKISNERYFHFLSSLAVDGIISKDYFYDRYDYLINDKLNTSNRTMTYSYEIPYHADQIIIGSAIESGFYHWEQMNPKLEFTKVESGGDIVIKLQKHVLDYKLGHATFFCYSDCAISVNYGVHNCDSRWSHLTKESLQNTVMHEIGHILGMDHTPDKKHLMYSPELDDYPDFIFHDLDYKIPSKIKVESRTLIEAKELDNLDMAHQRIEKALNKFGLTVEGYFENGERSTHPDFDNKLVTLIQEYNAIIDKIPCHYEYREHDMKKYEFLR